MDIYINPNAEPDEILEVATGPMEHLIVIVPSWSTSYAEMITVGPVFSYYEFRSNTLQRLNDLEWRSLMQNARASFDFDPAQFYRGPWASTYMNDICPPTSYFSGLLEGNPLYPAWATDPEIQYFTPNYGTLDLDTYGPYSSSKPELSGWDIVMDPYQLFKLLIWRNESSPFVSYSLFDTSSSVSAFPFISLISFLIGGIFIISQTLNYNQIKKR